MNLGRGGSKAIDGYSEEAGAETPCGPVPSTATRAPAPGPPDEEALPAALQAEARLSHEPPPEAKGNPVVPRGQRGRPAQGGHHRSLGKLGDFDPAPTGHSARGSEVMQLAGLGWSRQNI